MATLRRKPDSPDIIEAEAIEELHDKLDGVVVRVEAIEGAFPNANYEAHRQCHAEQVIKQERQRETQKQWQKLRNDLFFDIAKTVAKGIVGGAFALFVLGAYTKFGEIVNKVVDVPKAATGSDK